MRFLVKFLLLGLSFLPTAYAISSISVEIDHVESDFGEARNVTLDYALGKSKSSPTPVEIKGETKAQDDKQWSNLTLSCGALRNPKAGEWHCSNGKLASKPLNTPFDLVFTSNEVRGRQQLSASVSLKQASFNDEAGLHAGEKVTGNISLALSRPIKQPSDWQWQTEIDWVSGEIFWQPFYFASGGHRFTANGKLSEKALVIDKANLMLKDVGHATMTGLWLREGKKFEDLSVDTGELDLAWLYPLVLKPLLEKTALDNLEMAGEGELMLSMRRGEFDAFQLDLRDADIADKNGRFALHKINAALTWDYDAARQWQLAYASGKLLSFPLGPTKLTAEIDRYALTATEFKLPILDGAFTLSDVSAAWASGQWHWHTRASLAPISMPELSGALNWPTMQGQLSASIPLVTYSNGELTTDGALQFKVFNGNIAIKNLAMRDPLGAAPRLSASMQLRNLDLGALTRTFSFGAIEGKLDGDVNNLQLVNWQPVQFDAAVYSSPGRYPKKISQRAVENISSLGGAGAAAAVQRSFLRFFDDFNYKMIGLSCRLRNTVCQMGGIESVTENGLAPPAVNNATSPFVIVKGSGVPAITVLGYNHSVGWDELLNRLKRVTEGNSKPIIK